MLEKIKRGNSKTLELFSDTPFNIQKLIRTVIAFSNTAGGNIIIGVNPKTKEIIGTFGDEYDLINKLHMVIKEHCSPTVKPTITPASVQGKTVIVIDINVGNNQPYFIKKIGRKYGVYIRNGAQSKLANQRLLFELEMSVRNETYDSFVDANHPIIREDVKTLCKSIYYARVKNTNTDTEESIQIPIVVDFVNWGLFKIINDELVASNAYVLMSKINDSSYQNSAILLRSFYGSDNYYLLKKEKFSGVPHELLYRASEFVLNEIFEGEDEPENQTSFENYEKIFNEIISNALIHRDYQEPYPIVIDIYSDRIEVISPGTLYGKSTIENLTSGTSISRNKVINRVFKEMGISEQWGTGISTVIDLCEKEKLNPPSFEELGNAFKVGIDYRSYNNNSSEDTFVNILHLDDEANRIKLIKEETPKNIEIVMENQIMEDNDNIEKVKENQFKKINDNVEIVKENQFKKINNNVEKVKENQIKEFNDNVEKVMENQIKEFNDNVEIVKENAARLIVDRINANAARLMVEKEMTLNNNFKEDNKVVVKSADDVFGDIPIDGEFED